MAQEVRVLLIDDVDGGDADVTVSFALDGRSYSIDLSEANAEEMRAALAPWVAKARPTRASRAATRPRPDKAQLAEVRQWAKGQGLEVSSRGRIPAAVQDAYDAAH